MALRIMDAISFTEEYISEPFVVKSLACPCGCDYRGKPDEFRDKYIGYIAVHNGKTWHITWFDEEAWDKLENIDYE